MKKISQLNIKWKVNNDAGLHSCGKNQKGWLKFEEHHDNHQNIRR